jgi:hypothetical protein
MRVTMVSTFLYIAEEVRTINGPHRNFHSKIVRRDSPERNQLSPVPNELTSRVPIKVLAI